MYPILNAAKKTPRNRNDMIMKRLDATLSIKLIHCTTGFFGNEPDGCTTINGNLPPSRGPRPMIKDRITACAEITNDI